MTDRAKQAREVARQIAQAAPTTFSDIVTIIEHALTAERNATVEACATTIAEYRNYNQFRENVVLTCVDLEEAVLRALLVEETGNKRNE